MAELLGTTRKWRRSHLRKLIAPLMRQFTARKGRKPKLSRYKEDLLAVQRAARRKRRKPA